MSCPRCAADRVAAVALPERGDTDLRVCLVCGHLWSRTPLGTR